MVAVTTTTRQFINRAALASLAAYAVTSIHHVYGGLFGRAPAPNRLRVPIIMAPPLLIMLVSLYRYRRRGSWLALSSFSSVAMLFFVILLGLLHGGYAHAYKDILYLVAGPPQLYYSLNPDEHYPPDDIFFEITGVLDMLTGYLVALSTVRLIRDRQQSDHRSSVQQQASRSR
jgi:hypothetical protein